jgi:hypothetical protein
MPNLGIYIGKNIGKVAGFAEFYYRFLVSARGADRWIFAIQRLTHTLRGVVITHRSVC